MKILHTSDWHLGRTLYGRRRYEESAAFLDWLADQIRERQIDALLVAGDIFDTVTPGNQSQQLYYRFLHRTAGSCCRHIVIVGGNHDSPSFLDAPRDLLRALNVYVVGAPAEDPGDEVLVLYDRAARAEAVVCAVPYLRDRDIRTVQADESADDKNLRLLAGIRRHYEAVCRQADDQRAALGDIPLIAMGHLFAAGGRCAEGDGVRDLYVGTLAHVAADLFPSCIDYLALGHLHVPQQVAGQRHLRYSGSPLPMGFGEAGQAKQVVEVAFDGRKPVVTELAVPCFQELICLVGPLADILTRIGSLKESGSNAWLDILCTGQQAALELREQVEAAVSGTALEVRRIRNRSVMDQALSAMNVDEDLETLDETAVFQRCLEQFEVPAEEQADLMLAYQEILADLRQDDKMAEA
ncbi:MAG: exonuclease subunit SbcD [Clostridiaceae bacterium]|jgi:exonuclease SbcD|nr:exonuclease subunit SbcD [Clostridiaceae bacterium]